MSPHWSPHDRAILPRQWQELVGGQSRKTHLPQMLSRTRHRGGQGAVGTKHAKGAAARQAPAARSAARSAEGPAPKLSHTEAVELLTGFGLATAAGLNAYIPLLALGLLSRFTDLVSLPHAWTWLENGWVMAIVAALLVRRGRRRQGPRTRQRQRRHPDVRAADRGRHRVRRPAPPPQTVRRDRPRARSRSRVSGFPIAIGVVTALVVIPDQVGGAARGQRRDGGLAAPVLSTFEDITSIGLVFAAILLPVLVLVALAFVAWAAIALCGRSSIDGTRGRLDPDALADGDDAAGADREPLAVAAPDPRRPSHRARRRRSCPGSRAAPRRRGRSGRRA